MGRQQFCGIEFETTGDPWAASRPFPFLPGEGKQVPTGEINIEIVGADRPTVAQEKALQNFLLHERSTCDALMDATLRWVKVRQQDTPDWFEGVPRVKSIATLRKLIQFSSLHVLNREHGGTALIGFGFRCEWDVEHGLGVLTSNGTAIDIGTAETAFSPGAGPPDEACTAEQREARNTVLADERRQKAESQSEAERWYAERLARQREALQATSSSASHGTGIRELSRAAAETFPDVPIALSVRIDAPTRESDRLTGAAPRELIEVEVVVGYDSVWWGQVGGFRTGSFDNIPWPQTLFAPAHNWPEAKPFLDTVQIKRAGKRARDKKLQAAAVSAWREAFGIRDPNEGGAG